MQNILFVSHDQLISTPEESNCDLDLTPNNGIDCIIKYICFKGVIKRSVLVH